MAEVFKAKTFGVRGFERLLVIKRILPHLSKDEEFVEMFVDEAKICVELSHANICQVTDLGKIGDNYFIAMEFINGKDLRAILKKCYTAKTSLSIPQGLYVVMEILKGLDYAHRKIDTITGKPLNLIHRDISPQNIMISYHGEVKIVDFGIAKTESKLHKTQAGVLKGKFGYMSPEQAQGLDLDQRTDMFSTGILFYEMLTGRRLFLGENDFETLEAIKTCVVPPPTKYNAQIFQELEKVLTKALSKDREDRFSTIQEMLVALSKIFYATYSDFTAADLSNFLKNLFKAEIEQEQEAFKRAIDALSPSQVEAAASAAEFANDRLIAPNQPAIASTQMGRPSTPSKVQIPIGRTSISKKSKGNVSVIGILFKIIVFAGIPFLLFLVGKDFLFPPKTKPKGPPTSSSTPKPYDSLRAIEILSTPKGAKLTLDGVDKGTTPLTLDLAPKKVYEVRLFKKGYKPLSDQLFVTEDQTSYSFKLTKDLPSIGSLKVISNPPGAKIAYDQTKTDLKTPALVNGLSLNVEHLILVEKEGYRPQRRMVVLKQAEEEITIDLEKTAVTLKINVTPQDARVILDGQERGHLIEDLEAGRTYKLTIDAPGYVSTNRTIKPTGARIELDIELKRVVIETGIISLGAIPWAKVLIDGKELGVTPKMDHRLNLGLHEIIFRHPDFRDVKKRIEIKRGRNLPIIVDFRKSSNE